MLGFGRKTPTVDTADVAAALADGSAFLLDVREPAEYQNGHIKGSRSIPMGAVGARIGELPRDQPIYVICRSGNRSGTVTRALVAEGYDAHNMSGGMLAWQASGQPMRPKKATVI